jgi:hypothetical protein
MPINRYENYYAGSVYGNETYYRPTHCQISALMADAPVWQDAAAPIATNDILFQDHDLDQFTAATVPYETRAASNNPCCRILVKALPLGRLGNMAAICPASLTGGLRSESFEAAAS